MRFFILFFSLFSSIFYSNAQVVLKSFWQLSCPEKYWVVTHPFVAHKVLALTKEAIIAGHEMKQDTLFDGDESGGQVDAFRHSYWMALLSQKISQQKAGSLGKAHEKGNYRKYKKGKTEEKLIIPDSISGVMDLFNNNIGIMTGLQNQKLSCDSLKTIIKTAILEGKMKIISKNFKGFFLDCNGNVIEQKSLLNSWNNPKCLIPSNIRSKNIYSRN